MFVAYINVSQTTLTTVKCNKKPKNFLSPIHPYRSSSLEISFQCMPLNAIKFNCHTRQARLQCLVAFESIGKLGSLRQVLQKRAVKSEWNNTAKANPADFCLQNVSEREYIDEANFCMGFLTACLSAIALQIGSSLGFVSCDGFG